MQPAAKDNQYLSVSTQKPADTATISLAYEAVAVTKGLSRYNRSVNGGVASLKNVMKAAKHTYKCRNGTVTIVGYSQGAEVVGNTINALPADQRALVGSVVLLADPRRALESWHNRLYPRSNWRGVRGARPITSALKWRVSDFCVGNDTVCSADPIKPFFIGVFTKSVHTDNYQKAAVARLAAAYAMCQTALYSRGECAWARW
jgi:hypothetical protein